MALSRIELWNIAYQWQLLTRFANKLGALLSSEQASKEATRYLRYHHGLEYAEWVQVETFARDNRSEIEGAEVDARTGRFAEPGMDDGTGFDASTIAQQFRLLFGFAAQHTIYAEDVAQEYLSLRHNLGEAEWEAVEVFLEGQEHYNGGGELTL